MNLKKNFICNRRNGLYGILFILFIYLIFMVFTLSRLETNIEIEYPLRRKNAFTEDEINKILKNFKNLRQSFSKKD